ncbi:tol-pal system protein YbgF [Geomesophilobacter sediminis]|uniref:Tol-pal system protein YbgF n=1 Tax=Geomesophilobacter sediminis TaxID=2798584 RepID=A0A8J7JM35_9BACT|nr:tol-pal system protein YbgF [Geomesophilobacter sediminis]MBJ6725625.1 tol-pal system protein YbgF [Geomesophilobacter sediminis]
MQSLRLALISVLVLSCVGCATKDDLDMVKRDSDEMKSRIFTLNKSLGEVRGEIKDGIDKSLANYKQNMDTLQKEMEGYQKDMATLRKGSADLQATLDAARVDMQVLTGKVDDVRLLAQKPADDLALLRTDTNKRLASFDERLTKLEQAIADLQKSTAQVRQDQAALQQTPESLYRKGVESMKGEGAAAKAREIFAKFLELYPKHKLAANAHYWTGETYYGEKNYEQAILEYQEVIQNYPESEKAPAALLKQGMAFKALGDKKSAHYDFKRVIEEYPKSDEAKSARERLGGR